MQPWISGRGFRTAGCRFHGCIRRVDVMLALVKPLPESSYKKRTTPEERSSERAINGEPENKQTGTAAVCRRKCWCGDRLRPPCLGTILLVAGRMLRVVVSPDLELAV